MREMCVCNPAASPPHQKTFTVEAIVGGQSLAKASALKKKLAQMNAANKALEELKVDIPALVQEYLATLPSKIQAKKRWPL